MVREHRAPYQPLAQLYVDAVVHPEGSGIQQRRPILHILGLRNDQHNVNIKPSSFVRTCIPIPRKSCVNPVPTAKCASDERFGSYQQGSNNTFDKTYCRGMQARQLQTNVSDTSRR